MKRLLGFSFLVIFLCVSRSYPQSAWVESLAVSHKNILWSADHETGSLESWTQPAFEYAGGGIYTTGEGDVEAVASQTVAHSGSYSARATIKNAYRAKNGNRAVRLMRWTHAAWDDGGQYFPEKAYFSTWMYFPHNYNPKKLAPWDAGDGGWWNVFQFKSEDSLGESQPLWVLNVNHDDARNFMYFYLYTDYNQPYSWPQKQPLPIPVRKWVHVEALYEQSSGNTGRITIWQDGTKILDAEGVKTILSGRAIWGIGNYTDHISGGPVEGEATVYFDDCAVSKVRLSQFIDRDKESLYFPHFGNGTQHGVTITSELVLVNALDTAVNASLLIRNDDGVPMSVEFNGIPFTSGKTILLDPQGLTRLKTNGKGAISTGSVLVRPEERIHGQLILRGTFGEVLVPTAKPGMAFASPIFSARDTRTGIALMGLGRRSKVLFSLLDEAGDLTATADVELHDGSHRSFFLDELEWSEPVHFSIFFGSLKLEAENDFAATLLRQGTSKISIIPLTDLSVAP